jgi:hypothetical protein
MPVIRGNVIPRLHDCAARESARRFPAAARRQSASSERIGCSVTVEQGLSPPAGVGEPLAVLHCKVRFMLDPWHGCSRERLRLTGSR